jgi:enoyl-CoA hydratase/carnithine racemase
MDLAFDAETVSVETGGDVARVTVNRPDSLNALNVETLGSLADAFSAAEDAGARAVVLTGAGEKAFVAGADIVHMSEMSTPEALAYAEMGHRLCRQIEEFPAPVVAAVNGYAFGGGCELALACDLRVASERALVGQTEVNLGIIPGWGGTQRLPRLVGDELARRMIFFGERVDASDAHEYGLIGEIVAHDELAERVREMAAQLAAKPQHALKAAKDALNATHESSLTSGLAYERRTFAGLFGTHDQREGMAAFTEDRDPEFE